MRSDRGKRWRENCISDQTFCCYGDGQAVDDSNDFAFFFQPEWYLTQVLMWMSNNSAFIEETIQPILERAGTNISARVGPCRSTGRQSCHCRTFVTNCNPNPVSFGKHDT